MAERSTLIDNERTKLTATWMNSLASGIIITGVVAPLIAVTLQVTVSAPIPIWLSAFSIAIWLFAGTGLHLTARRVLRSLK
jgi:hypothetical protein